MIRIMWYCRSTIFRAIRDALGMVQQIDWKHNFEVVCYLRDLIILSLIEQKVWIGSLLHFEKLSCGLIMLMMLRGCTSESMNPMPYFQALRHRFMLFVTCYLSIFICSDCKNLLIPFILHNYHHLFVEQCTYTTNNCIWCVGDRRDYLYLIAGLFEREPHYATPPTN